ncbi:MAG: hypothetical protein LAP40_05555 [Acidobacteriia bacterium]|nr:hypothetical protein [Terriglobia bacterium]
MADTISLLCGAMLALLLGLSRRRQVLDRERQAQALRRAVQRLEAEGRRDGHHGALAA